MKSKKTGLSQMVAKKIGGNPAAPAPSPTKTLPGKKTVAKGKSKTVKPRKMKGKNYAKA